MHITGQGMCSAGSILKIGQRTDYRALPTQMHMALDEWITELRPSLVSVACDAHDLSDAGKSASCSFLKTLACVAGQGHQRMVREVDGLHGLDRFSTRCDGWCGSGSQEPAVGSRAGGGCSPGGATTPALQPASPAVQSRFSSARD